MIWSLPLDLENRYSSLFIHIDVREEISNTRQQIFIHIDIREEIFIEFVSMPLITDGIIYFRLNRRLKAADCLVKSLQTSDTEEFDLIGSNRERASIKISSTKWFIFHISISTSYAGITTRVENFSFPPVLSLHLSTTQAKQRQKINLTRFSIISIQRYRNRRVRKESDESFVYDYLVARYGPQSVCPALVVRETRASSEFRLNSDWIRNVTIEGRIVE